MPATFLPDCMAVCIPPDQNETFTADEVIALNEDGSDVVSDKESLLPSVKNNGHVLSTIPEAFEVTEPVLVCGKSSSVGAPLSAIPESEDYDSSGDHDDIKVHFCDGGISAQSHEEDDHVDVRGFAKTIRDDLDNDSETAMLFRHLLRPVPAEHVAFSGTDSHQYLFQHFDAENLEYEEAAAVRPKFIGHYLLGDCLGEGSYAKVKEALNTETLERTAVKIFSPVKLKRIPNGMHNVLKEVNILRRLDHPNVCRMKELLKKELKKKLYLIMDYAVCAISDLTKSLPQERLPAWKAHYYFLQVLDGLQYCHSRGVIHKDLKPSNLVITTKDTLKIIDFGVAEQLSPYVATDMITSSQGCPAVQPPQVADGTDWFSGIKLDVWSCGVTFFSLCAGGSRFPFVGDTVYELFANISEVPHEMPTDLQLEEPEFCSLIDWMLEKKEVDRPYLDQLRTHPWVRRHWPMPPAGAHTEEMIGKALIRSTDSFLPYIQAYYHSSVHTSRAGSICCMTGGKVPHHHHHYPRCHSHHLTPHNSVRRTCRQGSERRRSSAESRHLAHNHSILSHDMDSPEKAQEVVPEERRSHNQVNADQGCFSFKKWKICRVS